MPDLRFFHGMRDRALMVILLDTGMRISEALSLNKGDVFVDGANPSVIGKGNRERRIYITHKTKRIISEYIEEYLLEFGEDMPLFCDEAGERLTTNGASRRIADYGKKIGIEKSSAHVFRHTFAINFLKNGGDIRALQAILGHSTPSTCFIYLNAVNGHVKSAHDKASPVKNFDFID